MKEWIYYIGFFAVGILLGLSMSMHYVSENIQDECNQYILDNYVTGNKEEFRSEWWDENYANKSLSDYILP